jgi:hypothetical protein
MEKIAQESPANVLSYDRHNPKTDRGAWRVEMGYSAGLVLGGIGYAGVGLTWGWNEFREMFPRVMTCVVLPIAFSFVWLPPVVMSLGISLWIKQKVVKEVRFATFKRGMVWGLVGNLFPWPLFPLIQEHMEMPAWAYFGMLGWVAVFPAVAGMFLCYRWHLRD